MPLDDNGRSTPRGAPLRSFVVQRNFSGFDIRPSSAKKQNPKCLAVRSARPSPGRPFRTSFPLYPLPSSLVQPKVFLPPPKIHLSSRPSFTPPRFRPPTPTVLPPPPACPLPPFFPLLLLRARARLPILPSPRLRPSVSSAFEPLPSPCPPLFSLSPLWFFPLGLCVSALKNLTSPTTHPRSPPPPWALPRPSSPPPAPATSPSPPSPTKQLYITL